MIRFRSPVKESLIAAKGDIDGGHANPNIIHRISRGRRRNSYFILTIICILVFILSPSFLTNYKTVKRKDGALAKYTPANSDEQRTKHHKTRQRICILAGPHKTGTSSLQANFYSWSEETTKFKDSKFQPLSKPLLKSWVWPVPRKIAEIEHADPKAWGWSPSKVFYPMMEVLVSKNSHHAERSLYQKFNADEILDMYKDTIQHHWNKGRNIVFGTEAMDMIVKLEGGPAMLRKISTKVLPQSIDGDQITVIVVYRTPKVKHLVSMWHQNCNKPTPENKFYEWITTTDNSLGALDALGMVEMFLNETDWNVALVDLEGLTKDDYDISNFVACKVLGEECKGKRLKGLHGKAPIVTNVRSTSRPPNIPDKALDEIEIQLKNYDCKYAEMLKRKSERLKIYYPKGLQKAASECLQTNAREGEYILRDKMKQNIVKIVKNYEKLW